MSALTVVSSASAYVLGVFKDVFLLVAQLTIELLAGVRVLYLHTAIQRRPGQRSEHDAAITRLHEARARRWEPWRKLPATRRVVVSAAALMTALDTFEGSPGRLDINAANGGYRAVFAFQGGLQSGSNVLGTCVGSDGTAWKHCEPWKGFPDLQAGIVADGPSIATTKNGLWLWFTARSAQGVEEIRVAYRSGAL